jgi:hypothetical protein
MNSTSNITDWITSLTTVLLAVITGYYAVINHIIMRSQKKAYDVENRPYLAFEKVHVGISHIDEDNKHKQANIQCGLILKNVGKGLLRYNIKQLLCKISDIQIFKPKNLSNVGYLYPGQMITFYYDPFHNIDFSKEILGGTIEYEIDYDDLHGKQYKTEKKMRIEIHTRDQQHYWFFLEELEA